MTIVPFNPKNPRHAALMDAAWPVALRLQQFGYDEIAVETGASIGMATSIIRAWLDQGKARLIVAARTGHGNRNLYEAIPPAEETPAPGGDAFDQMWTVMRKYGAFSPTDLVAHCAVPVTMVQAASYCQTLLVAGYLHVITKAKPPHKQASYRLIKPTGPRAPRARNIRCLVDANTGATTPLINVATQIGGAA
jgi:hypothetical protein